MMTNRFLLIIIWLLFCGKMNAQTEEHCGTDFFHGQLLATDSVYARKVAEFDNLPVTGNLFRTSPLNNPTYVVPTVIHIMHKGEAIGVETNISDEAIRQAIKQLNIRYRNLGGFNSVDTEIEFVLAVRSPSGSCTTGIDRVDMSPYSNYMNEGVNYSSTAGMPSDEMKNLSIWDVNKYYNIWLVSEIDGAATDIYGYATLPSYIVNYGAVILAEKFIDPEAKVNEHELGHGLGLYHTFQGDGNFGEACPSANGCSAATGGGDCCTDTPPHKRYFGNCTSTTPQPNACDNNSTDISFVYNLMSYNNSECRSRFTLQQKNRMINALTTIKSSYLASNGNLNLIPTTAPVVNFQSNCGPFVCIGQTIQLLDRSLCIPNDHLIGGSTWQGISFYWTITNGTVVYNYTTQNIEFTVQQPGTYNVTLTITNALGTGTYTRTGIFKTITAPAASCIPTSTIAQMADYNISNVSFNTINNTTLKSGPYYDFTCSLNTIVNAGATYQLSLTAKNRHVIYPQPMLVYIDYNNNGSFESNELVFQGTNPTLTTATYTTNVNIPVTAVRNTVLRMRVIGELDVITNNELACTSSYFIGDIEDYGIYIPSGLDTESFDFSRFTLSPNPTKTAIRLTGEMPVDSVEVYTISGQLALRKSIHRLNPSIDVSGLSAGTYLLHIFSGRKSSVLKFIKE